MILRRNIILKFICAFCLIFLLLSALVGLIDFLELSRRSQGKEISVLTILHLVTLKLPMLISEISFFIILVAALIILLKLNNSSEIVIMRTSGMSLLRIISPIILIAFILGVLIPFTLNSFIGKSQQEFRRLENKHLNYGRKQENLINYGKKGLWINDTRDGHINYLIRISTVKQDSLEFYDVMFIRFNESGNFDELITANRAIIKQNKWLLYDGKISKIGEISKKYEQLIIATKLTKKFIATKVKYRNQTVQVLSLRQLYKIIKALNLSGSPTIKYESLLHHQLALPIFFVSMILLAAAFSISPPRSKNTAFAFISCIIISFILYFVRNLLFNFSEIGKISILMAIWIPNIIILSITSYYLIGKEFYQNNSLPDTKKC